MSQAGPLHERLSPALRSALSVKQLDTLLQRWTETLARVAPDLPAPEDTFWIEALSQHGAPGVEELHVGDLFLAFQALHRNPLALARLEALLREATRAIARINPEPTFVDEALQQLRTALLVPARGAAPKLAGYAGRGALRSWVKTAAMGTALNLLKQQGRGEQPTASVPDRMASQDVDLAVLKSRHQQDLSVALRGAFGGLTPTERNLLRMRFVHGLTTEALGAMHPVNRRTVARWIDTAQAKLLASLRGQLTERLRLEPSELDSLLRALQSDLRAGIASALGHSE
jgi:RNA polymerase sigma-70 factor, ECF subfamily